jgi:hypothetical protein
VALDAGVVTLDELNQDLSHTLWLYEGELIPLVQGSTDPQPIASDGGDRPTAVIVTALELEATAVRAQLRDVQEFVHEKGTVYNVGSFDGAIEWRVAVVIAVRATRRQRPKSNAPLSTSRPRLFCWSESPAPGTSYASR